MPRAVAFAANLSQCTATCVRGGPAGRPATRLGGVITDFGAIQLASYFSKLRSDQPERHDHSPCHKTGTVVSQKVPWSDLAH